MVVCPKINVLVLFSSITQVDVCYNVLMLNVVYGCRNEISCSFIYWLQKANVCCILICSYFHRRDQLVVFNRRITFIFCYWFTWENEKSGSWCKSNHARFY